MSRRKILIVGKALQIEKELSESLPYDGYEVSTVQYGKDAISKIKRGHFDLVISNLQMPDMDSLELLMNIKDLDVEAPVIVVSDKITADMILEAGAYAFVNRKSGFKVMGKIVKEALKGRSKYQGEDIRKLKENTSGGYSNEEKTDVIPTRRRSNRISKPVRKTVLHK